jgi:hypothetical protein
MPSLEHLTEVSKVVLETGTANPAGGFALTIFFSLISQSQKGKRCELTLIPDFSPLAKGI